MQADRVYDVVVIGSGAAGGMAAWNLTHQGVNVLVLDAGEKFNRSKFWSHVKPWQWTDRLDKGQHPPQFFLSENEQPVLTPPGQRRLGNTVAHPLQGHCAVLRQGRSVHRCVRWNR